MLIFLVIAEGSVLGQKDKDAAKKEEVNEDEWDDDIPEYKLRDHPTSFWNILQWLSLLFVLAALVTTAIIPELRGLKVGQCIIPKLKQLFLTSILSRTTRGVIGNSSSGRSALLTLACYEMPQVHAATSRRSAVLYAT